LSPRLYKKIWSDQYHRVLPLTVNDFELSAILPAVFYMFRFGHRRGKGSFTQRFGPRHGNARKRRRGTTIACVADRPASRQDLIGFDGELGRAILGDLLLAFNLENIRHLPGRDRQLQRVAPTHYMSSWVDLPEEVAHLRSVPEMIVAILANQDGAVIEPTTAEDRTFFPVARNFDQNLLLRAFSQGIERSGLAADLAADKFSESCEEVGLDQLLMVRIAQQLKSAPLKARG